MRGSLAQNAEYCSKEGKLNEIGIRPQDSQGKRNDIKDLQEAIKQGVSRQEMFEQFPAAWRYPRAADAYRQELEQSLGKAWRDVKVFVYAGATGTGKTRTALSKEDPYLIHGGDVNWFDGYSGQKTLIIDEWNNDRKIQFLLKVCDGYPLRLAIKGSFTYARWTNVYITTNLKREEFHPKAKQAHRSAFSRRMDEWCDFNTDEIFVDLGVVPLSPMEIVQ